MSRAVLHKRLDDLVMRTTHLESDLMSVKNQVKGVEQVTGDVKILRQQAQGAGTPGQWLIRFGMGVVGSAGWLVGLYTWSQAGHHRDAPS